MILRFGKIFDNKPLNTWTPTVTIYSSDILGEGGAICTELSLFQQVWEEEINSKKCLSAALMLGLV